MTASVEINKLIRQTVGREKTLRFVKFSDKITMEIFIKASSQNLRDW